MRIQTTRNSNNSGFFSLRKVALMGLLLPLMAAGDVASGWSSESRHALVNLNATIDGSLYFVEGWVRPYRVEEFRAHGMSQLTYAFSQCPAGTDIAACDREHAWKRSEQQIDLAQIDPKTLKIVEVSGVAQNGITSHHALIYRCEKSAVCVQQARGVALITPIPCSGAVSCGQARAELGRLIAIAHSHRESP
jgi:hypothetical protein